jgi:two-component system LytT family sensor kinase
MSQELQHNLSATSHRPESDAQDGSQSAATSLRLRTFSIGALLFTLGALLGAFFASLPIRSRTPGTLAFPADYLRMLGIGSLTFYACLICSPLYLWLARRFPIYQRHWLRNLALHFLITAALIILTGFISYRLLPRPTNNAPPRAERSPSSPASANDKVPAEPSRSAAPAGFRVPDLKSYLLFRFITESLPFLALIALVHAFEFHRRYRLREFETVRLQAQLTQSRLEALTAQLQPHFLFNTLQGISTLMHRDVKAADAMLSRLSDLLRQTLQRQDRQEVSLGEELELLDHYIEISCERFKDRLIFERDISADSRHALVPFFILQPLVENALQHGIARRAGVGRVAISAARHDETLHLSVTDDGPGLANEGREFPREGIGLSNTRQRLRQLYGDEQSLTLEPSDEGGVRVKLIIPFQSASLTAPQKVTT